MKKFFPSFPGCFACGKENLRGIQLSVFEDEGKVQAEFKPQSHLCGFPEIIHGGISSTVLDEVMWWASYAHTGKVVITGEITVRLLKPLLQERAYNISAEIFEAKKKYVIAQGVIRDEENTYCRALGKYFFLPPDEAENFKNSFKYQDARGKPIPPELRYII